MGKKEKYPTENSVEEQFRVENPNLVQIDKAEKKVRAKKIVKAILDDLVGRGGLQNIWEDIDADTQKEIQIEWRSIVEKNI